MTQPTLHVVFTPSGAGSLRPALTSAGRDDLVIAFFDDLSFGPINPPASSLRAEWVENELGWTGWDGVTAKVERFWHEALAPNRRKVAWLSRRSALEYAGFLEWLSRLGEDPCEIVDLTDVKVSGHPEHGPPTPPPLTVSVAMLTPAQIGDNLLFDQAKALSAEARSSYQALWGQLRAENAPLRVLARDTLLSAPISFFDLLLMSFVTDNWQKVAMIVGRALASQWDDRIFQTGDIFLAARVNALVEAGRLELQGRSALEMRYSEVRLPAAR
jgi:Protein of unknown function/Domain of unknown function (DUF1835)